MIVSLKCAKIEKLFLGSAIAPQWKVIVSVVLRKLSHLHGVDKPEDLKAPPSNRLENLKDDRTHQYGIRINRKSRACFEFEDGNALNVEIIDYH